MLLKSINEIKAKNFQRTEFKKVNKNAGNNTMVAPSSQAKNKLNRSLLGQQNKQEDYLIGLEKDLLVGKEISQNANDLHYEVKIF